MNSVELSLSKTILFGYNAFVGKQNCVEDGWKDLYFTRRVESFKPFFKLTHILFINAGVFLVDDWLDVKCVPSGSNFLSIVLIVTIASMLVRV